MTRETKIGIALMVLLVGVFGAIVYKKWNGRQPAVVAAAAETGADPNAAEKPAAASPAESEPPAAAATSTPPENPFAATAATSVPPAAQTEPGDPFGEAGFVRSEPTPAETVPGGDAATAAAAPAQAWPEAGESPFGGDQGFEPVAQTEPADSAAQPPAQPVAEPVAATDPVSDPFAAAATAEPQVVADAPGQPSGADDPFGAVTAEPAEAAAEPAPSAGESAADVASAAPPGAAQSLFPEDAAAAAGEPFAEASSPEPVETAIEPPPTEPSPTAPSPTDVAAAPPAAAEDPFAAADEPIGDAADAAAPGRLLHEESAVPVAGGDASPFEDEPAFRPAAAAEEFEAAEASTASPAPTGGTDFCVVEENDSFWSISKRVYGKGAYFHALARFNADRIKNPDRLQPGMKILTPPAEELAARFPDLVSRGAAVERERSGGSGFLFDEQGRPAYRVGKDDTLTGIAQAHLGRASRWVQIYEMNRDRVPDAKTLKPGTVLRLPGDASRVRLVPEG